MTVCVHDEKVEHYALDRAGQDAINQSTYPAVILRLHGHGSK